MHILLTVLLISLMVTSWDDLPNNQDIVSLVIIFLILMTCMFDQVVFLSIRLLGKYKGLCHGDFFRERGEGST